MAELDDALVDAKATVQFWQKALVGSALGAFLGVALATAADVGAFWLIGIGAAAAAALCYKMWAGAKAHLGTLVERAVRFVDRLNKEMDENHAMKKQHGRFS